MKTRTIDISEYFECETPEQKPEVTIKRIGFGEQNDIIDAVSNVSVRGKNDVQVSTKYGQLRTLTLLKCIVEAPFPITTDYISKELDAGLGEFLFEQIDQFNTLKFDKKK